MTSIITPRFPLIILFVLSVTQMLTTQADRFSSEEVHHHLPVYSYVSYFNADVHVCCYSVFSLLLRWSRCSLPFPQMWLETWTTRTWSTSSLTERKKTRSDVSLFFPQAAKKKEKRMALFLCRGGRSTVEVGVFLLAAFSPHSSQPPAREDWGRSFSSRPHKRTVQEHKHN